MPRILSAEEAEQHKQRALEYGREANRLIQEIDTSQRLNFQKAKEAGNFLIRAKFEVCLTAPGTWETWLYENFQLSQQTACTYMRMATASYTAETQMASGIPTTIEEFNAAKRAAARTPPRGPSTCVQQRNGRFKIYTRGTPSSHRRLTRTLRQNLARDLARDIMQFIGDAFTECGAEHDDYDTYGYLNGSDVWRMLRHHIKQIVKSDTRELLVPYCRERRAEATQFHQRTNALDQAQSDEPPQPADEQTSPDDEVVVSDQQPQPEQQAEQQADEPQPRRGWNTTGAWGRTLPRNQWTPLPELTLQERVQAARRRPIATAAAEAPPEQQPDQPLPEPEQPLPDQPVSGVQRRRFDQGRLQNTT